MIEAVWCYETQRWKVALCDGEKWTGDRIWLATGCKLDVNQDPLLSDIKKQFPIQVNHTLLVKKNRKSMFYHSIECSVQLLTKDPHLVSIVGHSRTFCLKH